MTHAGRFSALLLFFLFTPMALLPAQTAAPSPGSPAQTSDKPVQLIPRSPDQAQAERKAARRILLKVVVSDQAGAPVRGLSQADFAIADNGVQQPVTWFQAVEAGGAHPPDRIVFLIDVMNNSFENIAFERKGIAEFLALNGGRLAQPTSFVIFSDTGIKVGKPSFDGRVLSDDLKNIPTPIRENNNAEGRIGYVRRFLASTLAITKLLAYEERLPGRTTLLWFGPGWPMLEGASYDVGSDRDVEARFSRIVEITNGLREAGMTIDALAPAALVWGGERFADYYKAFLTPAHSAKQAAFGNLALPVITVQSGGQVLKDGTLPQQIAACVADAESYYLLAYEAAPATHPDEYRALSVKMRDPHLSARTNAGYYAQP